MTLKLARGLTPQSQFPVRRRRLVFLLVVADGGLLVFAPPAHNGRRNDQSEEQHRQPESFTRHSESSKIGTERLARAKRKSRQLNSTTFKNYANTYKNSPVNGAVFG